jgi:tetratricopeptide (TPR) repeat protein
MDRFAEALARHNAGDFAGAEPLYRAVLAERPDHDDALGNLGLVLARRGDPEAEAALRAASALRPDKVAHLCNLGTYFMRRGRTAEAAEAYRQGMRLDPDFPNLGFFLGEALLGLGELEEGWRMNDMRSHRRTTPARSLSFPEWRGEPLAGRSLLVWAEQGLGDHILAARYLRRLGADRITFACPPALARLFAQLPAQVVPCEDHMVVPRHDFWTLPMSLPRWAPGPLWDGPYLTASGPPRGRFGLAWRGNALPDPGRSLPREAAERLLALPGAVDLDPEATGARDFQDTAELVAGLDLVVSVDTSVAHLAGAMGRPLWVLLQANAADWRWTQPFYPDARIFRQPRQGDWPGAVQTVAAALG